MGDTFPFRRSFSLAFLLEHMRRRADTVPADVAARLEEAASRIEAVPGLAEPRIPLQRARDNAAAIEGALALVSAVGSDEPLAVVEPFSFDTALASPQFDALSGSYFTEENADEREADVDREAIYAFGLILAHVYRLPVEPVFDKAIRVVDPESGLPRYFQLNVDERFVSIDADDPPPLSDSIREELLDNLTDREVLAAHIDARRFEFRGFLIFRAIETTDQTLENMIKNEVLRPRAITDRTRFGVVQEHVRALLRRPEVELQVAAVHRGDVLLHHATGDASSDCIVHDALRQAIDTFADSVFLQVFERGRPVVIRDLPKTMEHRGARKRRASDGPTRAAYEEHLLSRGVRSLIAAPLVRNDEPIGVLSLTAHTEGALTPYHLQTLQPVLPLFAESMQRAIDDFENRVQRVIREECTAIHPAVVWRFEREATAYLERQYADPTTAMGPIGFDRVYPLYAATDIRGSSVLRNQAIQADLLVQLRDATAVLSAVKERRGWPIVDELLFRTGEFQRLLAEGLGSGEEVSVLSFLRNEVERHFDHFVEAVPEAAAAVATYRGRIHSQAGAVYDRRAAFDESVRQLNHTISRLLDREQVQAQEMFPHYFDKQTTDGVDFSMYVGASLVETRSWDTLHLKNLRLWQLLVLVRIGQACMTIRSQLPVPLETTHLVVVQNMPLDIAFRYDEKRFHVEGAYNIRYEIMKKRIDKATVEPGGSRLTQVDTLSVVFSQKEEEQEYRRYLHFMAAQGLTEGEPEEIRIGELQGVSGLRALRVSLAAPSDDQADVRTLLQEAQRIG